MEFQTTKDRESWLKEYSSLLWKFLGKRYSTETKHCLQSQIISGFTFTEWLWMRLLQMVGRIFKTSLYGGSESSLCIQALWDRSPWQQGVAGVGVGIMSPWAFPLKCLQFTPDVRVWAEWGRLSEVRRDGLKLGSSKVLWWFFQSGVLNAWHCVFENAKGMWLQRGWRNKDFLTGRSFVDEMGRLAHPREIV